MDILKQHLNQYPNHQPEDIYKLIYQGEFAGGHIIDNEANHFQYLKQEAQIVKERTQKPIEWISDCYARIYLDGLLQTDMRMETVHRMVLKTAYDNKGLLKQFEKRLDIWKSLEDVSDFVKDMKEKNYPLVHHSALYKHSYLLAYRIIDSMSVCYYSLVLKIESLIKKQKQVVIAIDGDAASGKSTVAAYLKQIFKADVIHMDDFFLQDEQRTVDRLNEIGGNLDYERFLKTVIEPLHHKKNISYAAYDCQTKQLNKQETIIDPQVLIIEGSYSMRYEFMKVYDLTVVLHLDKQTQLNRLKKRHSALFERFQSEWIPKEKAYQKAFKINERATLIFDTSQTHV